MAELYAAGAKTKSFDKFVKDLEGLAAAVKSSGIAVERFFATGNYSEKECAKVVDLLTTTKEPLADFKSIKDDEAREVLVDNEGNLEAWRAARKAVAAVGMAPEVKGALDALAREGALNRLFAVARKAAELKAAVSKTVDVVVASAVPLSKAQQDAVRAALPAYAPAGTNLTVAFATDAAVLGGLRVDMKNTVIDLSATTRLVEVLASARMA